jgi:hypothetical protein
MRRHIIGGWVAIALGWFFVPVLSGQSPFVAYELAQQSPRELHHNKVIGVIDRFRALTYWPTKLSALVGLALAVSKRNLATLIIAVCAAVWVGVEIFFALRGLPGVPRYMFEAGAAMIVVAGVGVGWVLAETARLGRLPAVGGIAAAAALVGFLVPDAVTQERIEHNDLLHERARTIEIHRLDAAIRALGGGAFIRSCGDPSADVEYVSILAWYVHMNVGKVGHRPHFEIFVQKKPAVLFTALPSGWIVHTYHLRPADRARCASLNNAIWFANRAHPGGVLTHRT